ncbi:unnamed protein product [Macrosiphum euphorbiae]|uniref:Uncharacterized protein n=1 Tax=Macrosiphum euphorbiae TaxID=13131 RepID=A0AAV0Y1T9_9HEMI|nr:unnamed protein product [Macrosiphum euphorbiae]
MLKSSSSRFDPLEIGSTVRVSIPDVDRARGAPRNLLAVVLDVENDLYKLGTEHGHLKHKYTRSKLVPCKEKLLDIPKFIKEKELTLREAAGLSSISGTQGYQRCHCKTKCKNNKCACRSSDNFCNSICHGSLPCENK